MQKLWFFIVGICIVGFVVFAIGIVQSFQVTTLKQGQSIDGREQESQQESQRESRSFKTGDDIINIAVMGDSIARGTGDQSGYGLTKELVNMFEEQGVETDVYNIAVDGFQSQQLVEVVRSEESIDMIKAMDIAIISIGGNDSRGLLSNEADFLDPENFQERLNTYTENLQQIMQAIRDNNQECYIMLVGSYNPFDSFLIDMLMIEDEYMNYFLEWNYQAQRIMELDEWALYVPTYDLFKWNTDRYISYDRIHPNAEGYQVIAERIAKYFHVAAEL